MFNLVEGSSTTRSSGFTTFGKVPNYTVYNLTFLAVGGVLFILIGWLLRTGSRAGMGVRNNIHAIDVTASTRGGPGPMVVRPTLLMSGGSV